VAWNRALTGDPVVGYRTLEWAVPAVRDATRRLAFVDQSDRAAALAAVGDAVWAVTMVDAAMVRYHLDAYDRVLGDGTAAERRLIEESLAGLRFVRNQIHDDAVLAQFVEPSGSGGATGQAGVLGWTWKSVTSPPLARRRPRARAWEAARYRAYQARLAGHSLGDVFERAGAFLHRTAAEATVITDLGV